MLKSVKVGKIHTRYELVQYTVHVPRGWFKNHRIYDPHFEVAGSVTDLLLARNLSWVGAGLKLMVYIIALLVVVCCCIVDCCSRLAWLLGLVNLPQPNTDEGSERKNLLVNLPQYQTPPYQAT
jgi:hypothetical protein